MRIVRASIRFLRTLLVSFGLLFLVVTFTPMVKVIISAINQDWYDGNGDVLVVLGSSMLVSGTGPNATLGADTYLRCVYAAWILRQQQFRYVVVTGSNGVAEAMARYLEQTGLDPRRILIENRADSTYQNAVFTRQLLERQYGAVKSPPIVILTSDYHSWRARRVFAHMGFAVHTIPVPDVTKRSALPSLRWPAFLTLITEFAKDAGYFVQGKI